MRWFNHMLIGGATTAVVAPHLVPVAVLGSTAPDWLEYIAKAAGYSIRHRTTTHVVIYWLAALAAAVVVWDYNWILTAFFYGGLTHCLCDALTIAGVPFSPLSDRRFTLLGGRLRTGQPGEYLVGAAVCCVCLVLASQWHSSEDFLPFFFQWGQMYEQGIVDAAEWKANRLRFF